LAGRRYSTSAVDERQDLIRRDAVPGDRAYWRDVSKGMLMNFETSTSVMAGLTTSVLFAVLHRLIQSHLNYLDRKWCRNCPE
jgi:hypothetical protein